MRLIEDFPHLPDLKPFDVFSLCFTPDMVSKITTETMRYTRLKNNHSFHVSDNDVYQFLGLILISGYHTLPGEKDYWSTKPSLSAPIFSQVMSRNRFQKIKLYFHLLIMKTSLKVRQLRSIQFMTNFCKTASSLEYLINYY